jgi:NADH:ubiquinone oxidoreductase subunit 3 (subunit A)
MLLQPWKVPWMQVQAWNLLSMRMFDARPRQSAVYAWTKASLRNPTCNLNFEESYKFEL